MLPLLTLHRARARPPRRCAGGTTRCRPPRERAAQLGLQRRRVPLADHRRRRRARRYWPAGTAAFHVNADIADAVVRYVAATGDDDFERDTGVELLVETARLWRSLGHHDHARRLPHRRRHRPRRVQRDRRRQHVHQPDGPREPAGRRRRRRAASRQAAALGVDDEESAAWRDAAEAMHMPYNDELGVHEQRDGFTRHQVLGLRRHRAGPVPAAAALPVLRPLPQAGRQAGRPGAGDVHCAATLFDEEQKARNFAYYEPLTVRDSSLSACCQAVIAAEVGHLELAYDYLGEAALMDLDDLEHNTRDGLHIASLAGTWTGAGGRVRRDAAARDSAAPLLRFAPRLPEALSRLAFRLLFRGRRLRVEVRAGPGHVHPGGGRAAGGAALRRDADARRGQTGGCASCRSVTRRPPPAQPPGRAPLRRQAKPTVLTSGMSTGRGLRRVHVTRGH